MKPDSFRLLAILIRIYRYQWAKGLRPLGIINDYPDGVKEEAKIFCGGVADFCGGPGKKANQADMHPIVPSLITEKEEGGESR